MPSETCNRVRVERYFLEEATGEEKRETDLHVKGCARCKEHLDFMFREQQAYLAVRPFSSFAAKHLEKKAPRFQLIPGPRWLPAVAGAMACLALLAVFRMPDLGGSRGVSEVADATRAKGGEVFDFHFRRDGKLKEGNIAEAYRAGDELQFVYSAGTFAQVTLASVDAEGTVSLYRQEGSGPASLPAKSGKLESFPFSVTLDAAPGSELFVLSLTQSPLEIAAVEAWLGEAYKAAGGNLAKLEKDIKLPAAAQSSLIKTLLLKKAAP